MQSYISDRKAGEPLERSYHVQRLSKPRLVPGHPLYGKDNPFAFGGGLKNGGLSDEAMSLIRNIFTFEYMGSAEFEFGSVPAALQHIASQRKKLVGVSFEVELKDVAPPWQERKKKSAPDGSKTVYVICRKDDVDEVEVRIRQWAREGLNNLKEQLSLSRTLRPYDEWDGRTVGWLEIDNGFFFFTDEEMWRQTAELFSVKVTERTSV